MHFRHNVIHDINKITDRNSQLGFQKTEAGSRMRLRQLKKKNETSHLQYNRNWSKLKTGWSFKKDHPIRGMKLFTQSPMCRSAPRIRRRRQREMSHSLLTEEARFWRHNLNVT